MEKPKDIELRSEQIRDIIGQIPPFLIRCGNSLLCLLFILLAMAAIYVPIPHRTTTPIHVEEIQSYDTTECWKIQVPDKLIPLLPQARHITLTLDTRPGETFVPLQVTDRPTGQEETGKEGFRTITLIMEQTFLDGNEEPEIHKAAIQGQLHMELPPSPFMKRFFLDRPSAGEPS